MDFEICSKIQKSMYRENQTLFFSTNKKLVHYT